MSTQAVQREQLKQQQLVVQSSLQQTQRLEDIGHPLLVAAASFCGQYVSVRSGLQLANAYAFGAEYAAAARSLGFNDTLVIAAVARGSASERAGLRVGDRVALLQNRPAPRGRAALADAARALGTASSDRTVSFAILRGDAPFVHEASAQPMAHAADSTDALRSVEVPGDQACPFGMSVQASPDLNAWADGRNVYITDAMLRFARDDGELALVLAHEIAHNAMRHVQAKQSNASLGGLLGAIVDIFAATRGVNTGGEWTKAGMNVGALTYSQEFELEADYVGLYILARAGRDVAAAPQFWRQMAIAKPGSIRYASTHPTGSCLSFVDSMVYAAWFSYAIGERYPRAECMRVVL